MIVEIGNILKGRIQDAPYVDRIAGIVMTMSEQIPTENGTFVKKFPASCDVDGVDCDEATSRYKDLIPNTSKKSVIYFEDISGVKFLRQERNNLIFEARPRLVVWLNMKKLGKTDCSISSLVSADLIRRLLANSINTATFNRVKIDVLGEPVKSNGIFSRYTFKEEEIQYLMYPYDYFALDLKVEFAVNENCIDAFTVGIEDECNNQ